MTVYSDRVIALNAAHLLGYWRLNESSGTTATDSSGNGYHGTTTDVIWGDTGIGDGATAGAFNGSTSVVNVYSAGLAAAFDGTAGTIAAWIYADADAWADSTVNYVLNFAVDSNNYVNIIISGTNDLEWRYKAGGTFKSVSKTTAPQAWVHVTLTWDAAADEMKAYYNAVQEDTTQTSLGTWAGTPASTAMCVGAGSSSATSPWDGILGHATLWDVALSEEEIRQLAALTCPTYWEDVKAFNEDHLLAYWRLNESSGATVYDSSDNAYNGVATGVTWGDPGIGDGATSVLCSDSTSYINIYSAGLDADFTGLEGSAAIWFLADETMFADGQDRFMLHLGKGTDTIELSKNTSDYIELYFRIGAFVLANIAIDDFSADGEWHYVVATWSYSASEIKLFLDGEQWGDTEKYLYSWSASGLSSVLSAIGSFSGVGSTASWDSDLAHCAIWDVALTDDQVALLALQQEWITDRTAIDITNREKKAFFNVSDWMRINRGIGTVQELLLDLPGAPVILNILNLPVMTTIPTVENINDFVENIELVRLAGPSFPAALGVVELDYDYVSGSGGTSPDYTDVNAWENNLELMIDAIPRADDYKIHCGVARVGMSRLWQARFRG